MFKFLRKAKRDLFGGFKDSLRWDDPVRPVVFGVGLGALGFFIFYFNILNDISLLIILEPLHIIITSIYLGNIPRLKSRLIFWIFYFILFDYEIVCEFSITGVISFFWTIWLTSYWLFELRLINNNKKLSFRLEYFRSRIIYYWGYSLFPGVLVYFNLGHIFLFYYPFIFETSVVRNDNTKPKYAYGLPHNGNWIPFSFEDFLEYGME